MSIRERGREFLDNRADTLKGSLTQGAHPRKYGRSEYPRLREDSDRESRDEATQRGMEELYQQ